MKMDGGNTATNAFICLLTIPESGHVILSNQLTGISALAQAVIKAEWEYGQVCMLFRMGKPTHFVPLGMTHIKVFGSICITIKNGVLDSAQAGQGGLETAIRKLNNPNLRLVVIWNQ